MADKNPSPAEASPAEAPPTVSLAFVIDYWRLSDGERIRTGQVADLPQDEAMDVLERGLAKRVKADA